MTDDIRDISIAFEARKVSMNQNKDGFILRLAIHPNDVPPSLIQDWVGTNYVIGMTRLGDDSAPEAPEYLVRANRSIQSAGMLARNPKFQHYLLQMGYAQEQEDRAQMAVDCIREMCGVQSRTEFRTDKDALEKFERIRDEFEHWVARR